jgi:hypothetical protein
MNSRGNTVGQLERDASGNVWWVKRGLLPTHKLKSPAGWAMDAEFYDDLERAHGKGVRLYLVSGQVLVGLIEDWRAHAYRFDRGYGPQIVLPDKFWKGHERAGGKQAGLPGLE